MNTNLLPAAVLLPQQLHICFCNLLVGRDSAFTSGQQRNTKHTQVFGSTSKTSMRPTLV